MEQGPELAQALRDTILGQEISVLPAAVAQNQGMIIRCPATTRFHTFAATFWSDFKGVVDNPFGLLWLLTGFSIVALAAWASLHPATVPMAIANPLLVVVGGFLVYFAWRGLRSLSRSVRVGRDPLAFDADQEDSLDE